MTEFMPTVALATLIMAVVNVLKYARAGNVNGVVTQVIAWAAGVGSVMLFAQTEWADGVQVGNLALSNCNAWSQLFVGLTVASTGSFLFDLRKAFDNTDSAAKPDLIPPPASHVQPPHQG